MIWKASPRCVPGAAHGLDFRVFGIAEAQSHGEGAGKKSGCFIGVNVGECIGLDGAAFVLDVFYLAADQMLAAAGLREVCDERGREAGLCV